MHLRNQRAVLVPSQLTFEIEQMSKAALMDIAWSMATRLSGQEEDPGEIMRVFRQEGEIVLRLRKHLREIQSA
jgi:hypothetical protein